MKVLSIKQPWADLIVQGFKNIENRSWQTSYRGLFLIHASKQFDTMGYVTLREKYHLPEARDFRHRGCLVGVATLKDCVHRSASPWFQGPYGFVLQDVYPITPIPWRGRLGFFQIPDYDLPFLYRQPSAREVGARLHHRYEYMGGPVMETTRVVEFNAP